MIPEFKPHNYEYCGSAGLADAWLIFFSNVMLTWSSEFRISVSVSFGSFRNYCGTHVGGGED
jgi:hypothetical protein